MCYAEHRFRLKACRNDILLAKTLTEAVFLDTGFRRHDASGIFNEIDKYLLFLPPGFGFLFGL